MKKLVLALTLVAPFFAQADIIKCSFTEPFITTTYSMTQSSLTWVDNVTQTKKVIKNVSFQIVGQNQFELWDKNKNVLMKMNLDYKGSDGMSDLTYPYAVEWTSKGLYGGCESNFLKAAEAP